MQGPNAYGWWLFALLSLSVLSAPLAGQEGELEFKRLSVEDGLSHASVWAIVQDEIGFLWLGTQEGLNRYDGYEVRVYKHDPEDSSSLAHAPVWTLLEDHRGGLWIGTGGGLDRFLRTEERFVHYRHDADDAASLSHDGVLSLLEDRRGTLWVGTQDGLSRLDDPAAGTFTRFGLEPVADRGRRRLTVDALYEDRSGNLWVGTQAGLFQFDRRAESLVPLRQAPSDLRSSDWKGIYALQEDPQGRLWIGTRDGLKRLDPRDGSVVHYRHDLSDPYSLAENVVLSLHLDRTGELWVGTESQGLDRVALDHSDGAGAVFTHTRHEPLDSRSLSDNSVFRIYEDRTGILWLTGYDGVNKYDRRRERFGSYRLRPGREETLSDNRLWAIREDRAGELWVGTYDRGLDRFDRQRRTVTHYPPDPGDPGALPHGTVSTLYEDRSGILWIGTWGGLSKLEREDAAGGRDRFVTYRHDPADPTSLSDDGVYAIHEDRAGRLWVGTYVGLNRLERVPGADPTLQRFVRYPSSPGEPELLGEAAIYAICEDRRGALWFGSDRAGLFRLEDPDRFQHLRHDPDDRNSLSSDKIAALYEDRSGVLWIGTYGSGLNRLDRLPGEQFRHYWGKDGLPSDTVLGILEDGRGHLWLATAQGLSRFDPETESFRNYDADDGLQGDLFSSRSAFRSPSGEMFFAGIRGFNAFFPDRIEDDPHPPPVAITDFLLFNQPAPLRGARELVLSHRDYVFALEFAALHYSSPRKNRYAYRLEGFDRDWIATDSGRRFAQYSNLSPGGYVFRVRASNGDGVWNEEGASISIVVLPAPWKTWWAYTFYGLALLAAVAAYARSHRRKLGRERAIAERERAVARDLRELAELKDLLLADRAAELEEREQLIAELRQRNAELARFNYTVSHDLRNPLVTIKAFLGLAQRDVERGDGERLGRDLRQVGAAADKMGQLLEELLELSRIGRMANPFEEVALGDLAREAAELLAGPIAERAIALEIAPRLPTIVGDRPRLLQVLQNLLQNAVSYMGEQPSPRIELGVRTDADEPVFYVRDNGVGIEERYHQKVFGLFERLDAEGEGTGVGLALVKRIVEVHGGRVWVESEGRGRGSTFCFTLPRGGPKFDANEARATMGQAWIR